MAVRFMPPTRDETMKAIEIPGTNKPLTRMQELSYGDLTAVAYYNEFISKMINSGDDHVVPKIPKPQQGDWLKDHRETGQSLTKFLKAGLRISPHGHFNTVAVVVLGDGIDKNILKGIKLFLSAYYQLNVEIIGPVSIDSLIKNNKVRTRINSDTHKIQLYCEDSERAVTNIVNSNRELCRNVVATIGLTMTDLTPGDGWNFVYGQASLTEGHAIVSMARFSPEFTCESISSDDEINKLILQRTCKVLAHELGHVFGLRHCIYHHCLMVGVNHVGELLTQPLLECPVCLNKLIHSFGWNLVKRYSDIMNAASVLGFDKMIKSLQVYLMAATAHHNTHSPIPSIIGNKYSISGFVKKDVKRRISSKPKAVPRV